jgi:hypothetical protein
MSDQGDVAYIFTCPVCEESLEVNESMKEALVDRGCVLCSANVTADAFTRTSSADPA